MDWHIGLKRKIGDTSLCPVEYLQDWFSRRQKKKYASEWDLIDEARNGVFAYFALGTYIPIINPH